jgi:hypothetical protein
MIRGNTRPFLPSDISAKCLESTPWPVATASNLSRDILGMSQENSMELEDCTNSLIQKLQMSEQKPTET